MPDFLVANHGSIFTVTPLTPAATEWTEEHITTDETQWLGAAFVVEHRYIGDIVDGMRNDGLTVE